MILRLHASVTYCVFVNSFSHIETNTIVNTLDNLPKQAPLPLPYLGMESLVSNRNMLCLSELAHILYTMIFVSLDLPHIPSIPLSQLEAHVKELEEQPDKLDDEFQVSVYLVAGNSNF